MQDTFSPEAAVNYLKQCRPRQREATIYRALIGAAAAGRLYVYAEAQRLIGVSVDPNDYFTVQSGLVCDDVVDPNSWYIGDAEALRQQVTASGNNRFEQVSCVPFGSLPWDLRRQRNAHPDCAVRLTRTFDNLQLREEELEQLASELDWRRYLSHFMTSQRPGPAPKWRWQTVTDSVWAAIAHDHTLARSGVSALADELGRRFEDWGNRRQTAALPDRGEDELGRRFEDWGNSGEQPARIDLERRASAMIEAFQSMHGGNDMPPS